MPGRGPRRLRRHRRGAPRPHRARPPRAVAGREARGRRRCAPAGSCSPTSRRSARSRVSARSSSASSFGMAQSLEVLHRTWHVEGQSVRPDHRMVAHTGFLTHARLLVPPSEPARPRPRRRARCAAGGRATGSGSRPARCRGPAWPPAPSFAVAFVDDIATRSASSTPRTPLVGVAGVLHRRARHRPGDRLRARRRCCDVGSADVAARCTARTASRGGRARDLRRARRRLAVDSRARRARRAGRARGAGLGDRRAVRAGRARATRLRGRARPPRWRRAVPRGLRPLTSPDAGRPPGSGVCRRGRRPVSPRASSGSRARPATRSSRDRASSAASGLIVTNAHVVAGENTDRGLHPRRPAAERHGRRVRPADRPRRARASLGSG